MKMRKLNNQGSTLLTVVIILAFIGILGSMMLSVTMTNLQMKVLERKAKENFYTCEATMDEIAACLHELTVQTIRDVYENNDDAILKNISTYIALDEEELNNELKRRVTLELIRKLGNTSGYSETDLLSGTPVRVQNTQIFDDYLMPLPGDGSITRVINIGNISIVPLSGIIVSDISVHMTVDDFDSRISTDMMIELPEFSFEEGLQTVVYGMEQPYRDYALVADGSIVSDNTLGEGSTGENIIEGSIYSGDDIIVGSQMMDYHKVLINGGNIITRGDIVVNDTGSLSISGITMTDSDTGAPVYVPAVVWADNIRTEITVPVGQDYTKPTTIDIDGTCIVRDDLTLNGSYSNVTVKGAYVGYTATQSSLGSSIIINGTGSTLDLSRVNSLILAGRAHVSVDDSKAGTTKVTDIMTGESVGIKSNQKAYLLPGRFIKDIKHNPVTSLDIADFDIPEVNFDELDPSEDIDYRLYVNNAVNHKIASKQTVEGDTSTILRYYYLNFGSGKQADDYLWDYILRNEYSLDSIYPFKLGQVILPNPSINEVISAGNLMYYDNHAVGIPKVGIQRGISSHYSTDEEVINVINSHEFSNPTYSGNGIKPTDTVGSLLGLYNKICHNLSLDSDKGYQEEDKVVESTTISSDLAYIQEWLIKHPTYEGLEYYGGMLNLDVPRSEGKIIVVNGNTNIYRNFAGLMVVNGDVYIDDNVNIDGMILSIDSNTADGLNKITLGNNVSVTGRLASMGDIILGSDNTLTASDDLLESIFSEQGEVLKYIFRNLDTRVLYVREDPAENLVDLSTVIHFRNWRRE